MTNNATPLSHDIIENNHSKVFRTSQNFRHNCFAITRSPCTTTVVSEVTMERRLHGRHKARTMVFVLIPGGPGKLCRAKNLSANGVFIETSNMGLKKGTTVQLAFAINLGTVTKIHRRTAIVAHISRGGTGLMMENLTGTR
jgi:hypothetical protein